MSDVIDETELIDGRAKDEFAHMDFHEALHQVFTDKGLSREARSYVVPRFIEAYKQQQLLYAVRCDGLHEEWPDQDAVVNAFCRELYEVTIQHLMSIQELLIEISEAKGYK